MSNTGKTIIDNFVKSPSAALRPAFIGIIAAYDKYASFLRICAPCIWSFLLCCLFLTFYECVIINRAGAFAGGISGEGLCLWRWN